MKCTELGCKGDVVPVDPNDPTGACYCTVCFKDYSAAPVDATDVAAASGTDNAATGAATAVATDTTPGVNQMASDSSSSATRSRMGSSRMGSGMSGAKALGLQRKQRNAMIGNSSSTSRRRNALGGIFVPFQGVPKSDPRKLLKTKYLEEAIAARTCTGSADIPADAKSDYIKLLQGWQEKCAGKDMTHPPQSLLRPKSDGSYFETGVCPKCRRPFDFTNLEPAPLQPKTVIANQFEIEGVIYRGGLGYVYLARDLDLSTTDAAGNEFNEWVIIKLQRKNSEDDDAMSAMEKQMLANLRHDTIVSIKGFKSHLGKPLIILELIDGKTVEAFYQENGKPFSVAEAIALVIGMVAPMTFLHEQKPPVLNPDTKPNNYMITGDGPRVKLIDGGGFVLSNNIGNITSTKGFAPKEVDLVQQFGHECPKCKKFVNEEKSSCSCGYAFPADALEVGADENGKVVMRNFGTNDQPELKVLINIVDGDELWVPYGPSVWSDQYSLGRCLMWLCCVFDYKKQFRWELPKSLPEFSEYPSFATIVKRMTAENPDDRFPTLADAEEQLWGVLREAVAIDAKREKRVENKPLTSSLFDGDTSGGSMAVSIRFLPALKVDQTDKGRGDVETILKASTSVEDAIEMMQAAHAKFPDSREIRFRLGNLLIDANHLPEAEQLLTQVAQEDPDDWRNPWYIGKLNLAKGDYATAVKLFDSVVTMLPGEPAAKLGLGIAAEMAGDTPKSVTAYDLVTLVEPQYTGASFGHARLLLKEENRLGAVEVLERVPAASIAHVSAVMEQVRALISGKPTKEDLVSAAARLDTVRRESFDFHLLCADFYASAIKAVEKGGVKAESKVKLLDKVGMSSRAMRFAAERAYLLAAHMADSDESRDRLVEQALDIRPFKPFTL